jgi:hypothetical protein
VGKKKLYSVVALSVVMGLLAGIFISQMLSARSVRAAAQASAWSARKYYLTKNKAQGNQTLNACAAGYHMASFYELFNVSTLQYDTALGLQNQDSGTGPPVVVEGWIRTGAANASGSGLGTPGMSNCNLWQTNGHDYYGSVVRLSGLWSPPSPTNLLTPITPWEASGVTVMACSINYRVWCVQD